MGTKTLEMRIDAKDPTISLETRVTILISQMGAMMGTILMHLAATTETIINDAPPNRSISVFNLRMSKIPSSLTQLETIMVQLVATTE